MNKNKFDLMSEEQFDNILKDNISDILPEEIVKNVTPWKKAINFILIGMALDAIKINIFYINYIQTLIGIIITILGFRILKNENKWFGACRVITIIRAVITISALIINTTIYQNTINKSIVGILLKVFGVVLMITLLICFRNGLLTVQKENNIMPHAEAAVALIGWYILISVFALIGEILFVFVILLITAYIFIIKSLFCISNELEEAGYAIKAAVAKASNGVIVTCSLVIVLTGGICGYYFLNSYNMKWEQLNTDGSNEIKNIKSELVQKGFPERILDDMSYDDILSCKGAEKVLVDTQDYPANEGRELRTKLPADKGSGFDYKIEITTVFDKKELRITGIALRLPNENETWKIIQHFEWTINPGFFGTESIQLWPAYNGDDTWKPIGEITGRVLYDNEDVSYYAPYYYIGEKTYNSSDIVSVMLGETVKTDIFAAFSMPNDAVRQRGYISYTITGVQDGYIISSWFNYTHQINRFQYPVYTAMEKRMSSMWNKDGAFLTIQDALQFYSMTAGEKIIN